MRYTLAPAGYNDHSADFTMYVSHMKANSGSGDNIGRRNIEAGEIRDDAATLGATAHVIYSGDLNILNSGESTYQTLISSTVDGGVGKAVDTLNPANNWVQSSTYQEFVHRIGRFIECSLRFSISHRPHGRHKSTRRASRSKFARTVWKQWQRQQRGQP